MTAWERAKTRPAQPRRCPSACHFPRMARAPHRCRRRTRRGKSPSPTPLKRTSSSSSAGKIPIVPVGSADCMRRMRALRLRLHPPKTLEHLRMNRPWIARARHVAAVSSSNRLRHSVRCAEPSSQRPGELGSWPPKARAEASFRRALRARTPTPGRPVQRRRDTVKHSLVIARASQRCRGRRNAGPFAAPCRARLPAEMDLSLGKWTESPLYAVRITYNVQGRSNDERAYRREQRRVVLG
jgi:hypothetical protein